MTGRPQFRILPRVSVVGLMACLLAIAIAAPAAGKVFLKGTGEPHLAANDPEVRSFWGDQSVAAGMNIVRVDISWRSVTHGEPADPESPGDPAYGLGGIDRAVLDAVARNHRVMLNVTTAPDFAIGPNESSEAPPGTWKPDPRELGRFVGAVATRYSGTYASPELGVLPRVGYIEVWNEPNLSQYITPQFTKRSTFAGDHYRRMVNAAAAGVRRSQNRGMKVIAGATAPYGDEVGGTRTRPLRFLRDFLCLDAELKPRRSCRREKADFDVLSHHPITIGHGPSYTARSRDDISMGDVGKLAKVLHRADRRNTVKGSRHPIWATEYWWESNPPDGFQGVPLATHARWIEQSLHTLWKHDFDAALWYLMVDQPLGSDGHADLQSGLFFEDRTRKPSFTAFRFPLVIEREPAGTKRATVWTIPPTSGTLEIQAERSGGFETIEFVEATAFVPDRVKVRLNGASRLRALLNGETTLAHDVK